MNFLELLIDVGAAEQQGVCHETTETQNHFQTCGTKPELLHLVLFDLVIPACQSAVSQTRFSHKPTEAAEAENPTWSGLRSFCGSEWLKDGKMDSVLLSSWCCWAWRRRFCVFVFTLFKTDKNAKDVLVQRIIYHFVV